MLYIGVDLGTSSVKLLLMDETGDIKAVVSREYPLYFPKPGWSEQKPEDWYRESMDGIKELIKGKKSENLLHYSRFVRPKRYSFCSFSSLRSLVFEQKANLVSMRSVC